MYISFARPQALTCQERRRSAAAAHAKGPARPMMQSAFRAKGLWGETQHFFKFFGNFLKICVALPEATPSRFVTLRYATDKRAPRRATII